MPVERLSYSSINTYMLCPKSWEFRYVQKLRMPVSAALPFGTAIHTAVQTYISGKALHPDDVRPLHELWPQCWQDTLAEQRQEINWDKSQVTYAKLGQTMLRAPDIVRAVEAIKLMTAPLVTDSGLGRVSFTEHFVSFNVPGVSVPIVGYIDLITSDETPIDLKTASRKWSRGREHFELQPDFYLIGLNQEGLLSSNKFRYYILTKTKTPTCQILETSRSWAQLLWTMQTIKEVWEAIQAGNFPPNTSSWKCKPTWCEYWQICRGG